MRQMMARGKITSLDLDAVRGFPGVVAVLTAKDIPGVNDCSPALGDDPILAEGEIEFHGQVIFAVVAETREIARRAARLAKIEMAATTPAVTVEDALAMGTKDVLPEYEFTRGDVGKALKAAPPCDFGKLPCRRAGAFLSRRAGGPGHAGRKWRHDRLFLDAASNRSAALHRQDAQGSRCHGHLRMPAHGRRLWRQGKPGGAMGGACGACGAHVTGRPAKCRLDRDEDMIMTGKRHDLRIDYKIGYDDTARLTAVDVDFLARCGYSADLSAKACMTAPCSMRTMPISIRPITSSRGGCAPIRFPTRPSAALAGPQGMMFAERMMDAIAVETGLDPLDVRKRNLYGRGRDVTPYGMKVEDNIALEVIEALEKSSSYRARRKKIAAFNKQNAVLKKGIALTPVKFGISFTLTHLNQAGALVHVYTDGSVHLNHGGTEMGQGLYIKVAQVVAEVFGISADMVRITATTTGKVPNTSPTAASSGSDLNGMAAKIAATAIKARMIDFAAKEWKVAKSRIKFEKGQVIIGNQSIAFGELAKKAHGGAGVAVVHRLLCDAQDHLGPAQGRRAIRFSISPMAHPARKSPSIR